MRIALILVCCSARLAAQDNGGSKQILKLANTDLEAGNGQIFSIEAGVENRGNRVFAGKLRIIADSALELIFRPEISFSVDSQRSYFSSFQLRVPFNTSSEGAHRVLIQLTDSSGNLLETAEATVRVSSTRNVELILLQNTLQVSQVGDTLLRIVKLRNMGNTDQMIRLLARMPGSTETYAGYDRQIFLPAFADTIISTQARVTKDILAAGRFFVSVAALYSDGDLAGMGVIEIQGLRSKKRFEGRSRILGSDGFPDNKYIEVNGKYLFTPYESFQIMGGSELQVNQSRILYNVDAQFWTRQRSPVYVRNTYVDFRKNDDGVLLGNISRNYDIPLTGRGGLGYITDTARKSYYEVGLMDGNYNLVGERNYPGSLNSKMAWGQYTKRKPEWSINTVGIYEHNRLLNEDDYLLSSELTRWFDRRNHMELNLGGAFSRAFNRDTGKWSGTAGVLYAGEWGRFSVRSENRISSGYYPGIRRGASNFDEKVAYRWKKMAVAVGYTRFEYDPRYVSAERNIGTYIKSDRIQSTVAVPIAEDLNLSLNPQYFQEVNLYPGFSPPLQAEIRSADCGLSLNYFGGGGDRTASLISESGFYTAPLVNADGQRFHFKLSFNGRIKWFSLNCFAQFGEFYAADVGSRYLQGADYTRIYTISPNAQKNFLNNRLVAELGLSYNKSNVSYSGIQINSRLDYLLFPGNRVYVSLRSYQYESPGIGINDFRIGYQRVLPVYKLHTGRKTLRVFAYRDHNFNNRFDEGDTAARNTLIRVNDELLITDESGWARYNGLPVGEYIVSAPSARGWDAPERAVKVEGNTRADLALRRNSILMGHVFYEKQAGILYEVAEDREQIVVRATAPNGDSYTTKTDEDGGFIFYVPPGQYEVEITPDELPDKVECLDCRQSLSLPLRGLSTLDFHFRIKRREVYLQRFVSPPSGKPRRK